MKSKNGYSLKTVPLSRQFTMDIGKLGVRKHHVKALLEVNVTAPLGKIRERRSLTKERISFTSWLLTCIARALDEHREIHAIRKGRHRLILFDDVDISVVVEKKIGGESLPIPLVIRNVNSKSIEEIHNEIEIAKGTIMREGRDFVIEKNRKREPGRLFAMIPQFLRLPVWKILLSHPHRVKKMMGTAIVTSLGMAGAIDGWFVPVSIHPVCFAIGSIITKPGMVNNKIEPLEFLKMTVLIDHDVSDGAPAARFIVRLKEIIESGYGL